MGSASLPFGPLMRPIGFLLPLAIAACDDGRDCPPEADCPEGAQCRCDPAGRILIERADVNRDGVRDATRYERTPEGHVRIERLDLRDDGSIERESVYSYDAQGRRTGRKGWQLRCDGAKTHWACTHEEPCAAPFDACSKCENRFELEQNGTLEPCGASAGRENQK